MKEHKIRIAAEVEKTMACLDNLKRLEGSPWLFTRIEQRITEGPNQLKPAFFFLVRLQPLLIASLLVLNIWIVFTVFNNKNTDSAYLETLAEEYALNGIQLTDYFIAE